MARILLVEPIEKYRRVYETVLTHFGFEIISDESASDALDRLFDQESFDLVIANLDSVKEKNFLFLKLVRLRLRKNESQLPIITISDYESDVVFTKAFRHGVNLNILRDNNCSQELLREARVFTGQVRSPFNVD
jgi:CheY-like chemotaxis protein